MTTIMPEGEKIRKAVRWVSEKRQQEPDKSPSAIADEAILQFDLDPNESEYLIRFVAGQTDK